MSFTNSTFITGHNSASVYRDVGSFLVPRDPSITNPWMRPHPTHGTNLCKLFDSSIESDEHLKVYLRIKPLKKKSAKNPDCYEVRSDKSFVMTQPGSRKVYGGKNCVVQKLYNFSHIFSDSNNSQEEIFERVIKENLARFVDGHNFTMLTYGASGSGKTYSLMGTEDEPGIVPRFLESLFQAIVVDRLPNFKPNDKNTLDTLNLAEKEKEIQDIKYIMKNFGSIIAPKYTLNTYSRMSISIQHKSSNWSNFKNGEKKYEVWVSFAEIYNDAIFDLLRDDSPIINEPPPKLRLIQSSDNPPYIRGLKWIFVRDGTEAFAALERGKSRLRYAKTNINSHSSRSHCLFSLKLVQYNSDLSESSINTFRLCDLAGSERVKKTGNEGARLNESRKINTSLHVLERCLASLRCKQDGQQSIPPYRESKLTSLLQNALSGLEAIAMLVTINPDINFYDETQHVLQFSSIAKEITGYNFQTMDQMKKSKSCIDIKLSRSDQSSDMSMDMKSSEISFLYDEIATIKVECEKKIQQRERDVRMEITSKFQEMMKQKDERFEKTLEKQSNHLTEMHKWEKETLRKQMERNYDDLHEEYEDKIKSLENIILQMNSNKEYADAQTQTNIIDEDVSDAVLDTSEVEHHCDIFQAVAPEIENLSCNEIETDQHLNDCENIENSSKLSDHYNHQNSPNSSNLSNNEQKLTNDEQKLTNDEQKLTNDEQKLTNNEQKLTNDEQKLSNNEQKLSNDEQKLSDDERILSDNKRKLSDTERKLSVLPLNDITNNVMMVCDNLINLSIAPNNKITSPPSNRTMASVDVDKTHEIENINLSPEKNNEKNMFNKFYTEKKQKDIYLTDIGASTMGNSRRKLFTRREFDEMAAETKPPPKSTRCLTFDEESPGAIKPPKLEKPYKMALRERKTKK